MITGDHKVTAVAIARRIGIYEEGDLALTGAELDAMSDSITEYAREALLYQAVAEAMDIAPTQEQIDTYTAYTETYGANYCTMVALMDAVSEALTTGAQVK